MDPGQDDLPETTAGQISDRGPDLVRGDARAPPPDAGDDAERAAVVAAVLDLQVSPGPERNARVDVCGGVRPRDPVLGGSRPRPPRSARRVGVQELTRTMSLRPQSRSSRRPLSRKASAQAKASAWLTRQPKVPAA